MPKKLTTLPPDMGGRLKGLRSALGLTQTQLADKCGVSQSVISSAEKGDQPPPLEVYYWLACDCPDVDLRQLLCGKETTLSIDAVAVASLVRPIIRPVTDNLNDLPPEGLADDYVAVPLVDGKVAAGYGALVWKEVQSLIWVYKPALDGRKNMVAARVMGNSMLPTIPDDAIVIIDRDIHQPTGERKHIWALRTEDGDLQIKRLHRNVPPPGSNEPESWWVFSDNFQEYPPGMVWTGDFEKLLIGQVVWMWRSLA